MDNCVICNIEFDSLHKTNKCRTCVTKGYKLNSPVNDCRTRYHRVRQGAKLRRIPFELHYDEFSEYYGRHCAYCGVVTPTVNLDRVDNNKGYTVDNVVPCCPECNRMKGSQSVDVFIGRCKSIADSF